LTDYDGYGRVNLLFIFDLFSKEVGVLKQETWQKAADAFVADWCKRFNCEPSAYPEDCGYYVPVVGRQNAGGGVEYCESFMQYLATQFSQFQVPDQGVTCSGGIIWLEAGSFFNEPIPLQHVWHMINCRVLGVTDHAAFFGGNDTAV
jgi:hypothetical protein